MTALASRYVGLRDFCQPQNTCLMQDVPHLTALVFGMCIGWEPEDLLDEDVLHLTAQQQLC